MSTSTKKVNFLLDKKLAKEMEMLVPPGKRSRVINDALRKELLRIKRERATEKLMSLRSKGPKVSTQEIVKLLRHERYEKDK